MKRLIFAACAALALASCATAPGPGIPTGPIASTQATTVDEKALIALELVYSTAATAFIEARDSGRFPAATIEAGKQAMIRADDALEVARTAYRAGDAATFATQARLVATATAEASRLLPAR